MDKHLAPFLRRRDLLLHNNGIASHDKLANMATFINARTDRIFNEDLTERRSRRAVGKVGKNSEQRST